MAGAEFQGRCYVSAADAADAYFSSHVPNVVSGPTSYVLRFEFDAGVWKSVGYSIDSQGTWTQHYAISAPLPAFPECNPAEGFNDGMVIGWGIASAMIAVWAITHLRKGLFR